MKSNAFLLFALLSFSASCSALAADSSPEEAGNSSYESFRHMEDARRQANQVEGLSYMVGGALGIGTSIALSLTATEVLPKLGYSAIQILSSAGVSHGASLYFIGDDIEDEGVRLKALAGNLEGEHALTSETRRRILDRATDDAIARMNQNAVKSHRIRGVVRFATALGSVASIVFAQSSTLPSTMALGFAAVMATAGGVTDFLYSPKPADWYQLKYSVLPAPAAGGAALAVSYRW